MSLSAKPGESWLHRNAGLLRIVGARLTSVQFVLDYLILGFDEKGALTTLVWPEIIAANETLKLGQLGYRDRLCALIEQVVTCAVIDLQDAVDIQFQNAERLHIPLCTYGGDGERAILTAPSHYLQVL